MKIGRKGDAIVKKRSFGYDEKAIREVLEEKVEIPNSVEQ